MQVVEIDRNKLDVGKALRQMVKTRLERSGKALRPSRSLRKNDDRLAGLQHVIERPQRVCLRIRPLAVDEDRVQRLQRDRPLEGA
jgi:hypothetical protein